MSVITLGWAVRVRQIPKRSWCAWAVPGGALWLARLLFAIALLAASVGGSRATSLEASRFYEDANERYQRRDLTGAIVQLKNALKADAGFLPAHVLLGKAMLRRGELNGAEVAFQASLKLGVDPGEIAPFLAQLYLQIGKPNALLDTVPVPARPAELRAEVLSLRAAAYWQLGNERQAYRSLEEARSAAANSAAPYIAEVPIAVSGGKAEQARAAALKATQLAPANALAWSALGSALHAARDAKPALAAFDKAIAIEPRHAESRVSRAALLLETGRDKEAAADLEYLKKEELEDVRSAYLRALLAGRTGDSAAVTKALGEAAHQADSLPPELINANEQLVMAAALAHYGLRNWQKAREYLEKLSIASRRNQVPKRLLASVYLESGALDLAGQLLVELRRVVPDDPQVLFLLGSVYLGKKQFSQAAEMFERAAARSTEGNVMRELGIAQLALGRDAQGLSSLEKAFAANPKDVRAGIELATVYARQGRARKALETTEAILAREPSNLAMQNFLGTVKASLGDRAGAMKTFETILSKDKAFRPALLNLARLESAEMRFDRAKQLLDTLLALAPDDADALFESGALELKARRPGEAIRLWRKANDLQRADSRSGVALVSLLIDQKQADQALDVARDLVSKFPRSVPVMIALGRANVATANAAGARQAYQSAGALAGSDALELLRIAQLQLAIPDPDGSVASIARSLQSAPGNLNARTLMVQAEMMRGDTDRLTATLKELVAAHPREPATLIARGNVAMMRKQYAAALEDFRAAQALRPQTVVALSMAQAMVAKGDTAGAETYLGTWVKAHPADAAGWKAFAEVSAELGGLRVARDAYQRALALEPDEPLTLNNFAMLLLRLADSSALTYAEKAYRLAPAVPEVIDTLGWVLVQQGKTDAGLRHLRDARLRSPENPEIRLHLAVALSRSGRKAEAREELTAALASPRIQRVGPEVLRLKDQVDVR